MNIIIREVRFRALAAKGDIDKGLKLLNRLDTHFSKDPSSD